MESSSPPPATELIREAFSLQEGLESTATAAAAATAERLSPAGAPGPRSRRPCPSGLSAAMLRWFKGPGVGGGSVSVAAFPRRQMANVAPPLPSLARVLSLHRGGVEIGVELVVELAAGRPFVLLPSERVAEEENFRVFRQLPQ
ncbi:unnamed protein product [Gadus morhua 'NCC']